MSNLLICNLFRRQVYVNEVFDGLFFLLSEKRERKCKELEGLFL